MDFPTFRKQYSEIDSLKDRVNFLLTFSEETMQRYPEELAPLLNQSRDECVKEGLGVEAALCERLSGWLAFDRTEYPKALEHFERARDGFLAEDHQPGWLKALNGIASVHLSQGKLETGLLVYREALTQAQRLGDQHEIQVLQANIGETLIDLRQFAEAEAILRQSLDSGLLSALNESLVLNQLAKAYFALGRDDKGHEALDRSISLARPGQFLSALAEALYLLGSHERQDNQGSRAEELLQEAHALARQAGDRATELRSSIDLGRLRLTQSEPGSALALFREAQEMSHTLGILLLEAESLRGLAEASQALELWQGAYQALEQYHTLSDRLHDETITRQLSQIKADQTRRENELLKEQSRILTVLGDLGQKITASLDLETIVMTVYESIEGLMEAEIFGLGLYLEEKGIFDYRLFIEEGKRIPAFEVSINAPTFSAWCIRNRQDILINDIEREYGKYLSEKPRKFGSSPRSSKSGLYTPLMAEGKVLGILSAQTFHTHAYTDRDLATLKTLAASISVAVQNAKLFAQVHQMATVDSLTGAATRRYLFDRTEVEFQRFRREGSSLALVMIDLDHFKNLNDSWGHEVGDKVLSAFGTLCMSHKRPHDLFGRYGGEEFALVLSGTTMIGAKRYAERLCSQVRTLEVATPGGEAIRFTASFGVTVFDLADEEVTKVFSRADTALYAAKQAGRNQVATKAP